MGFLETIDYYYNDQTDPRSKDWLLMRSIWYPTSIILIYLIIVLKLAPDYMKNRPAYKLNTFIKCYNLFQIIVNAYLVREFASCYSFSRSLECRPVIYADDFCSIKILNAVYFILFIKLLDMIETVIFILRKKNNQVSFLHVYHHISAFFVCMVYSKYLSIEMYALLPILNCSIHVTMYLYYFLSNLDSPIIRQKINPFKRFLTIAQMVQFLIYIVQLTTFLQESCPVPKTPTLLVLFHVVMNLVLFSNFYKKSYSNKRSQTEKNEIKKNL